MWTVSRTDTGSRERVGDPPGGAAGALAPREGFLIAAKSIFAFLPTDIWLPVQSPDYKEQKS